MSTWLLAAGIAAAYLFVGLLSVRLLDWWSDGDASHDADERSLARAVVLFWPAIAVLLAVMAAGVGLAWTVEKVSGREDLL